MGKEGLKIALGYILICLIWGSTWLAIRLGLESITPFIAAGLRFLAASLFIYIAMKIQRIKLQTDPSAIKLYVIMGIFSFAVPFGLVYWAEQYIASGLTSVLFAIHPFAVIIFSRLMMPQYKVGPYQILGVALAFIGIVVIFGDGLSIDLNRDSWGMLAVIGSGVIQAWIAVLMKKHGEPLHPLSMNLVPLIIAGVIMTIVGFSIEDSRTWIFNSTAILSILYLASFGTLVTFTTYYWLLKRITVVILSISSFITPIIAILLGWLILGERLSAMVLVGSSLVLIGILFANFRGLRNYYKLKTGKAYQ